MRLSVLLGVAAATLVAGCGSAKSEDGGPTTERSYQVGNFDRIELAGAYDLTVHTGPNIAVRARGGEKVLEHLVVEVRDGVLTIHPEKRNGFHWNWSSNGKVTIDVTVPSLRGTELAGAGDVHIDQVKGDQFDAGIAGSGDLKIDRVEVGALNLGIAGAGNATFAAGNVKSAKYEIAGSGGVDAKGVAAETASISIAGSGSIEANATKTADVNIMGSGDVDLKGGAKCTVSKAGAGDVRCS
jgi:hypothetical protein